MQALGITGDHWIAGNSHSVDSLIHMYEQLGDALSRQYGEHPLHFHLVDGTELFTIPSGSLSGNLF
jgi:hypothetical protein